MVRLKVYCFSAFIAVLDGEVLTGFRSDKARALFAYLLLSAGTPIARTVLEELFWEGYDRKSAREVRSPIWQNFFRRLGVRALSVTSSFGLSALRVECFKS